MGTGRDWVSCAETRRRGERHGHDTHAAISPRAARVLGLQRVIGNRATARLLARQDSALPPVPNYQLTPPMSGPPGYNPQIELVPGLHLDPDALSAPAPAAPRQRPIDLFPRWLFLQPPPPVTLTVPEAAPASGGPPAAPDAQLSAGVQWAWHVVRPPGAPAGPDRSVQISLQRGNIVAQASVNLDTGQVQWMAGAQAQVSTPELHVLGAAISASAFLQLLAGLTSGQSAMGAFTVQAAAGAQVTIKWGPITASVQAGPQITWSPGQDPTVDITAQPAAGPSANVPGQVGGLGLTVYF